MNLTGPFSSSRLEKSRMALGTSGQRVQETRRTKDGTQDTESAPVELR